MTHDDAHAWACKLLHQTEQLMAEALKRSAPVPLPSRKTPMQLKPGVRRIPHTPRGQGRCRVWSVN